MDDRSGDVSEGGEEVCQQRFPEGIVFDDSPEEKVLVQLESVPAADDRVIVFFDRIRIAIEVSICQTQGKIKFFNRLVNDIG